MLHDNSQRDRKTDFNLTFSLQIDNIFINMPTKSNRSWTIQEEKILKLMREEQITKKQVSWQKIAQQLNEKFPKYFRTAKQCREKYINYLKIEEIEDLHQDWDQKQLNLLHDLYKERGPCWNFMSSLIVNRSQGCIKNKYNTCLRRAAKTLYNAEQVIRSKNSKKSIKINILIAMINFANQIKKIIQSLNLTLNPDCKIFRFRSQILRLCFYPRTFDYESFGELIKLIKTLNSKIRCFGVFKVKNKKLWNISQRGLLNICQFDKIILESNVKIQERFHPDADSEKEETSRNQEIKRSEPPMKLHNLITPQFYSQQIQLPQISQPSLQLPESVLMIERQNLNNIKLEGGQIKKEEMVNPYHEFNERMQNYYMKFFPMNFGGSAFMPLWSNPI